MENPRSTPNGVRGILQGELPRRGGKGLAFDAFISYSHAADGQLAPALQRAMQRLAKPWYRRWALRVFRDESALSANPHLWSSIQSALDESEWFVLLASPEAVSSEWVGRELDYWLSNKSADRILVVVTGGTWQWDTAAHALTGTAVPERLRDAFVDEPRHVDLQWAANEIDLDMHHARFRDVVAQLAAPMHGIAKDELDSEDVRQHRRARRLARGGVTLLTVLVVISLVFGTVAVVERDDARGQRNRANHATTAAISRGLASTADRMLADHEVDLALLLSAQSYRFATEENAGATDVAEARGSMLASLGADPALIGFLRGQQGIPQLVAYSPDGDFVVSASDAGDIRVWDAHTREPLAHQPAPAGAFVTTLSINRSHLLATATVGPAAVRLWDLRTNRPWRWQPPQPQNDVHGNPLLAGATLSDAGILATVTSDEYVTVNSGSFQLNLWNINTGRHVAGPVSLAGTAQPGAFSPDGRLLAVGVRRAGDRQLAVDLFDTTTGRLKRTLAGQQGSFGRFSPPGQEFDPFVAMHFSTDGTDVTAVASSTSDGAVATWNVATGQRIDMSAAGREQQVLAAAPDARELVVRDPSSSAAEVIDATNGKIIASGLPVPSELSSGVQNEPAAFDPTDRTLAIATAAGTLALLQRDELAGAPTLGHRVALPGGPFGSAWVAIAPSGRIAARLARVAAAPNIGNDVKPGGNFGTRYFSGSPVARLMDTSALGVNLQLVDTDTGKSLARQPPYTLGEAFGADNSLALSTPDGIVLWDPVGGRILSRITDPAATCSTPDNLVYSGRATSGTIAVDCDGSVATWHLEARRAVLRWSRLVTGLSANPLVLSSDGSVLALSTPTSTEILDAATAHHISTLPLDAAPGVPSNTPADTAPRASAALALSTDGRLVAVARASGSVDVIDARTGSTQRTLYAQVASGGEDATAQAVAFSPDGAMIVAGVANGALEAWDAATGTFVAQLDPRSDDGDPGLLGFATDGNDLHWLVDPLTTLGGPPATVTTYDFRLADWVADACRLAGRNLTHAEWDSFVGSGAPYQRTCPQWPAGT